jgi:hypothetical protein
MSNPPAKGFVTIRIERIRREDQIGERSVAQGDEFMGLGVRCSFHSVFWRCRDVILVFRLQMRAQSSSELYVQ